MSCFTSPNHSFKKLHEEYLNSEATINRQFDLDFCSIPTDLDLAPSDKNFSSILNHTSYEITPRLELECQASFRKNRILYTVYSIVLTVTHFCKTTCNVLLSNKQIKAHLFLTEYGKRFKSYVEFATYLNENLENLNVIVNYAYDTIFNDKDQVYPKFSVLRLFVRLKFLLI